MKISSGCDENYIEINSCNNKKSITGRLISEYLIKRVVEPIEEYALKFPHHGEINFYVGNHYMYQAYQLWRNNGKKMIRAIEKLDEKALYFLKCSAESNNYIPAFIKMIHIYTRPEGGMGDYGVETIYSLNEAIWWLSRANNIYKKSNLANPFTIWANNEKMCVFYEKLLNKYADNNAYDTNVSNHLKYIVKMYELRLEMEDDNEMKNNEDISLLLEQMCLKIDETDDSKYILKAIEIFIKYNYLCPEHIMMIKMKNGLT